MLSLYIVGAGKENMHAFIACLQDELKNFIKQNNASCYNLKTLWKAEANIELLNKNTRIVFPFADTTCEYWGFFNVQDLGTLYSVLFSSIETNESIYHENRYYTAKLLKSILNQIVHPFISKDSPRPPFDFRIKYRCNLINDSERMCIIRIDINSADLEAFEIFQHFVCKLDSIFPAVFMSAYIDDFYDSNSDFKFDSEVLTKRIINTGKAFYISNNLHMVNISTNESILQQYGLTYMSNGNWFTQNNMCVRTNYDSIQLYDLLIPQYMVVNWTDLSNLKSLHAIDFDTISVYYDKYSPMDPPLIFSRGYSPKQLDFLSKEYGDLVLQEQYTTYSLLDNL